MCLLLAKKTTACKNPNLSFRREREVEPALHMYLNKASN